MLLRLLMTCLNCGQEKVPAGVCAMCGERLCPDCDAEALRSDHLCIRCAYLTYVFVPLAQAGYVHLVPPVDANGRAKQQRPYVWKRGETVFNVLGRLLPAVVRRN